MSNTTSPAKTIRYGVFYLHPVTGQRLRLPASYTSEETAIRVAESKSARWGALRYFHAEISA